MDRLTALQLPHLLMMAGALLVVVGFIGYAFPKNLEGKQVPWISLDKLIKSTTVMGKAKGTG
jgi:hypothetical protein